MLQKKEQKLSHQVLGIVTMAEDDLYYTGGTIIMDHGHGISTIYSHLEKVMVNVGDEIKQGESNWNSWINWKINWSTLRF